MHHEPVEDAKLAAGARRAWVARHAGHPMRAYGERHPTLRRGVLELIVLATLLVILAHHALA